MTRLIRIGFVGLVLIVLTACGSPAVPVVLPPTSVLSTEVGLQPLNGGSNGNVVAAAPTIAASPRPTLFRPSATPTITLIPPTTTNQPPTATTAASPTIAATTGIAGDAVHGEVLFKAGNGTAPSCATCHSVADDTILVGPSQKGIASRAASRVPGQDAATYIRTSIVNPNAYLVPNPPDGIHVYAAAGNSLMYAGYAKDLTPQQIDDLVAYLLMLK